MFIRGRSLGVFLMSPAAQLVLAAPVLGQSRFELTVGGEVEKPLKLTAEDIAKLPRTSVRAKDHARSIER